MSLCVYLVHTGQVYLSSFIQVDNAERWRIWKICLLSTNIIGQFRSLMRWWTVTRKISPFFAGKSKYTVYIISKVYVHVTSTNRNGNCWWPVAHGYHAYEAIDFSRYIGSIEHPVSTYSRRYRTRVHIHIQTLLVGVVKTWQKPSLAFWRNCWINKRLCGVILQNLKLPNLSF